MQLWWRVIYVTSEPIWTLIATNYTYWWIYMYNARIFGMSRVDVLGSFVHVFMCIEEPKSSGMHVPCGMCVPLPQGVQHSAVWVSWPVPGDAGGGRQSSTHSWCNEGETSVCGPEDRGTAPCLWAAHGGPGHSLYCCVILSLACMRSEGTVVILSVCLSACLSVCPNSLVVC